MSFVHDLVIVGAGLATLVVMLGFVLAAVLIAKELLIAFSKLTDYVKCRRRERLAKKKHYAA